ncbi:MAG: DEAD/DEAH box helicase [Verrucomicrobiales bacterium]|nr:DEAD/DEAH box helicase [Verrucomicrobiales bacterium]
MIDKKFSELGLPQPLVEAVEELGFEAPSAIQAAAIPPALEGKDLVGLSETGSGKTAAFGLASLAQIDTKSANPQLLVVCPTRELAVQVCGELQRLGKKLHGLHVTAIYGGAPIDRQMRSLRNGVQAVVGTPGRLIDLVKRGSLDLSHVKTAVLDEADRMLDMGFVDDMENILRALPDEHQTLFFSATMNPAVERLIGGFGNDPQTVEIERKSLTVDSIEQLCFQVRQRSRIELVSRIVDLEQPKLTLVFCNTKRSVDECNEALLARGYSADRLHGDIVQNMRERVLRRFREGTVEILVATDVAARGIDIDDIDLVINYELPQDPEDYVHRIGRTGRAGRTGKAVSFIYGRDAYRIKTIERFTRQKISRADIPTQEMVNTLLADQLLESVSERLQEEPDETTIQALTQLKDLGHDWDDIAGALMEMVKELTVREGEEIAEDRPGAQRKRGDRTRDDHPRVDDRSDFDPNRERPQKREFRDRHNRGLEEGMVKLFLSLGKRDRINPGDIVGMLHNECHLERGSVGHIKLMPNFSFVEVREEVAQQAINESRNAKLRGKSFKLDIDRGPGQGGGSNNFRSDDRKERRGGKGHRRRDDERRGGRRHDRQDRGSGKILDRSGRGKD